MYEAMCQHFQTKLSTIEFVLLLTPSNLNSETESTVSKAIKGPKHV